MIEVIGLILVLFIAFMALEYYCYRKSGYREFSGKGFWVTRFSRTDLAEYRVFSSLKRVMGFNKILFHVGIPEEKEKGTVVDVIFLHETGMYVMKLNNFVGEVKGKEEDKEWRLSLINGKKRIMYNPLWRNQQKIDAIKALLSLEDSRIFKSYIVFCDRCNLKEIKLSSQNARIIKRNELFETIKGDIDSSDVVLSHKELYHIYLKLSTYVTPDNKANN